MSHASNTSREEGTTGPPISQPIVYKNSVMRDYLESDVDFEWPEHLGNRSGEHCDFHGGIPLKWIKDISNTGSASIDMYETDSSFRFQKRFVVKQIRDHDSQKAREKTEKEVKNMKGLRHPHVTALLGTFTHQARLNILIFPAARCDLRHFMERLSKGIQEDRVGPHSGRFIAVDSAMTSSRYLSDSNVGSTSKIKDHDPREISSEPGSLTIDVDEMIKMLRGYFVCLSRALSYLHRSNVRHKDIKPGNILIDASGSVILTDFGISRRFPVHTTHATNDQREFTRKYASPEIMKGKNVIRDDSSDVFSLGCVFVEMVTLVLGKNLDNLSAHCASTINDSGREEAYHCNLGQVYSWLDVLGASVELQPVQEYRLPGEVDKTKIVEPHPDDHMSAALIGIRQMLDETPSNRPASRELWQCFQHVSPIMCRDCDPRSSNMWEPSAIVQNAERVIDTSKASATLSQTTSIHEPSLDIGRHESDNARPAELLQYSEQEADTLEMSSQQAVQHDQRSLVPNQRRANGREPSILMFRKITPNAQTRILVYDVSQARAFETQFGYLRDQEYTKYPLPRFRQNVEIGERGDLIAKVDLRQLKLKTRVRRLRGDFPWIYVVNSAAQPSQV